MFHPPAEGTVRFFPIYQPLKISRDSVAYKITYQSGLPLFDYASLSLNQEATKETWEEISKQAGLNWLHQENLFVEFDRESLQPFMASQEGPALVPEMSRVPLLAMPLDEARLVVPVTPRVAPLAMLTAPGAV